MSVDLFCNCLFFLPRGDWLALSVSGLMAGESEPFYGCRHVNTVSQSQFFSQSVSQKHTVWESEYKRSFTTNGKIYRFPLWLLTIGIQVPIFVILGGGWRGTCLHKFRVLKEENKSIQETLLVHLDWILHYVCPNKKLAPSTSQWWINQLRFFLKLIKIILKNT